MSQAKSRLLATDDLSLEKCEMRRPTFCCAIVHTIICSGANLCIIYACSQILWYDETLDCEIGVGYFELCTCNSCELAWFIRGETLCVHERLGEGE